MASLFVLNVPEFQPLIDAVRALPGISVGTSDDYVSLSAPNALRIERVATGLRRAVWFGALTAGYVGVLERFDDDALLITGD